MATLFATMLSSLTGGGAAVGTGAATAGAAAGGGLSFGSIASTVVGGLAAMFSGAAQGAVLDQQAVDEETRAVQSELEGRQDALDALRNLNADMSKILVAGYASGIGSEGSIEAAQREAERVGDQNMNLARDNARFQSQARRGQAREFRAEGRAARLGGVFNALQGGFSLFDRRKARG